MADIYRLQINADDLKGLLSSLSSAQNVLKDINTQLNQSGTSLNEASTRLNRDMKGLGTQIKRNVLTPLQEGYKTAKNIVMALGLAAAGAVSLSLGSQEKKAEAEQGGVSVAQQRAFEYAQKQNPHFKSLSLSHLQNVLGDWDNNAIETLGLNRAELKALDGKGAMDKVMQEVSRVIKQSGGSVSKTFADAVKELTGLNVQNKATQNAILNDGYSQFNKDFAEGVKIWQNIDLSSTNRELNKFWEQLKAFGMGIAQELAPMLNQGLKTLQNMLDKLRVWIKGDAGQKAIKTLNSIGSSLIKIGSELAPYFMQGLQVIASALEGAADFLNDPKSFIKSKGVSFKEFVKDMWDGDLAKLRGYGKNDWTGEYDNSHLDKLVAHARALATQKHEVNVTLRYERGDVAGQFAINVGGAN